MERDARDKDRCDGFIFPRFLLFYRYQQLFHTIVIFQAYTQSVYQSITTVINNTSGESQNVLCGSLTLPGFRMSRSASASLSLFLSQCLLPNATQLIPHPTDVSTFNSHTHAVSCCAAHCLSLSAKHLFHTLRDVFRFSADIFL